MSRPGVSSLLLLATAVAGCDGRLGVAPLPPTGDSLVWYGPPSDTSNPLEAGFGYGEIAPPLASDAKAPEAGPANELSGIEYVVVISVDGLAPRFVDELLLMGDLPTFRSLQIAGAWTHNARADYTHTVTLPNHTSMLTGRPVSAVEGMPETTHHGYGLNSFPTPEQTLHNTGNPALDYVVSAFDVAHDLGLKTCLYAGKTKFILYEQSYNDANGAPDVIGEDNGRDKIDISQITDYYSPPLIDALLEQLKSQPCHLTFLHIVDTDSRGHALVWGGEGWLQALRQVDAWVGAVHDVLMTDERLRGRSALILTADHGGVNQGHSDATNPLNYTIPFYVVAPGLSGNRDLHSLVRHTRQNPGATRPSYTAPHPPIRNGDAFNLALALLRLPPVPGSLMHSMGLVD